MPSSTPQPTEISEALSQRVLGQEEAVREVSIAIAKRLAGLVTGNILMIGSSGTGKTSLMRAVELFLAADPELAKHSTLVRVHANVLAEQTVEGRAGEVLLTRILDRAREQLGDEAPMEAVLDRVSQAVVFVDEIDKIRSVVGGQPNVLGIRAQEALLTLIENEAVPFTLPAWAGGKTVTLDASGLLFVAAGAFEGLYDSVYDRVTIGADRGSLQSVSVMGEGKVHEELNFSLRDWLRYEDLFDYGLTPAVPVPLRCAGVAQRSRRRRAVEDLPGRRRTLGCIRPVTTSKPWDWSWHCRRQRRGASLPKPPGNPGWAPEPSKRSFAE